MKNIATTVLATLAVLLGASAFAQSPSFAEVCESQDIPTVAEYESNPGAYADNFCALATYAPQRAARQLNSMIALVRAHNNPNRFYWNPRIESGLEYIQLLRPWMAEQGWWIEWDNNPKSYPQNLEVRYFTADQRELPKRERTAVFRLFMYPPQSATPEDVANNRDEYGYKVYIRFPSPLFATGDERNHGYIQAWRHDLSGFLMPPNQYRVSIGQFHDMTAEVLSAAVPFVLDCLADTVIYEEIKANCNGIVEVGSP